MESSLIQWLQAEFTTQMGWRLSDDAAQLRAPNSVVTTDSLLEGVHFTPETAWSRVGHKALAVNLSDLAAMAARPQGAVCSLALPRKNALETAQQLYVGMAPLLEQFDMELVGGDTNVWDGPLVINIAAWGEPEDQPLRRTGGRPGDRLLVTGALGGSLLGRHLDFLPRVNEAVVLMREFSLHAGMDITDGLVLDLSRMAAASGCGAVLDLRQVPIADAARQSSAAGSGQSPLEHALHDGEDFELLLALPADAAADLLASANRYPELADLEVSDIGELTGDGELLAIDESGARRQLEVKGYIHG